MKTLIGKLVVCLCLVVPLAVRAQWVHLTCPSRSFSGSFAALGDSLIHIASGELFRSTDFGDTWLSADSGFPYGSEAEDLMVWRSEIFVINGFRPGILASTDTGKSWHRSDSGFWEGGGISMVALGGDTIISSSGPSGLARSTDGGHTWNGILYGSGNHLVNDTTAHALAASDGSVFAGTDYGGVFRSRDGGNNWVRVLPLATERFSVNSIVASGSFILAGCGSNIPNSDGGVYRSTDWGTTWLRAGPTFPNLYVSAVFIVNGVAYAGMQLGGGVMRSTDSGVTWHDANAGMTGRDVESFGVCGPYLFAGGSYGPWRRRLSEFDAVSSPEEKELTMVSAYPNPFSSSSTISLSPKTSGYAEVSVVNLLGVEVTRLFSGELPAGEHTFTWDARGMMPGMYMGVVHASGRTERIPMMLTR